jgi:hypothetical protein
MQQRDRLAMVCVSSQDVAWRRLAQGGQGHYAVAGNNAALSPDDLVLRCRISIDFIPFGKSHSVTHRHQPDRMTPPSNTFSHHCSGWIS